MFAPTATKIVVLGACFICGDGDAADDIVRWTSTDGGTSFGAREIIGEALTISQGIGPNGTWLDAQGLFVTPAGGNTALVAAPVAAVTVVGSGFVYTPSVVPVAGTPKLVYAASDLGAVQYAVHIGPALSVSSIGSGVQWTTSVGLTSPEGNSNETQLNSGPAGAFLTYRRVVPSDDRVVLRRFDAATNTFGAATEIQGGDVIDDSADYPDSSQDAAGRVHVVWLSRYADDRLRYARSDTTGANFSAPANIAQGETFIAPDVAAAPDGGGWAAWQGVGDTPIRVVRIEPAAETPPPDPTPTPSPRRLRYAGPVPAADTKSATNAAVRPGTVVAQPVSGEVLIRRPGSSRFERMSSGAALKRGTVVDVTNGRISLRSRLAAGGRSPAVTPSSGEFYGGVFVLAAPGTTTSPPRLRLSGDDACDARAARKRPPRKRRLWGDAKGRFETTGRYASAINSGTLWLTEDRCEGTLFRVVRGSISVRRAGAKRTVRVAAGESRLVRRRR